MSIRRLSLTACCALAASAAAHRAQEARPEIPVVQGAPGPGDVPETMSADASWPELERGVRWLLDQQRPDGSWASDVIETVWEAGFEPETYYAWQMSSQALGVRALLVAPADTT